MNQSSELLAATVALVHPEPELRGIYARRLRHEFLAVESCSTVEDLVNLFRVQRPDVIIISLDALNARANRALRQLRRNHAQVALVTLGETPSGDRLKILSAFGAVSHIDPQIDRVGEVAAAARRASLAGQFSHYRF